MKNRELQATLRKLGPDDEVFVMQEQHAETGGLIPDDVVRAVFLEQTDPDTARIRRRTLVLLVRKLPREPWQEGDPELALGGTQ